MSAYSLDRRWLGGPWRVGGGEWGKGVFVLLHGLHACIRNKRSLKFVLFVYLHLTWKIFHNKIQ